MKRIIATITVFVFVAFTAWLWGYDFDQRNGIIAYLFVVTCFLAGLVWTLPNWKEQNDHPQ